MATRSPMWLPAADSMEALETDGRKSTLRRVKSTSSKSTAHQRRTLTLKDVQRQFSVRFSRRSEPQQPSPTSANKQGATGPDFDAYEDVARGLGSREHPKSSHPYFTGPAEFYRVYPARVDLLAQLLNLVDTEDAAFEVGTLHLHCSQRKSKLGGRISAVRDAPHPDATVLRVHDRASFPLRVRDMYSAACFEAAPGEVAFDAFAERVPVTETIILNRLNRGVAAAADRALDLWRREGEFALGSVWDAPRDSETLRFAHRIARSLQYLLALPAMFPLRHLGGFGAPYGGRAADPLLRSYGLMSPAAVRASAAAAQQPEFDIVEAPPRRDLEQALLAEAFSRAPISREPQLRGRSLLLCSPLFALYANREPSQRHPDPASDLALAVSMLFNAQCVDRAGLVPPLANVRVTVQDMIPEAPAERMAHGGRAERRRGVSVDRERADLFKTVSPDMTHAEHARVAEDCGLVNLLRASAHRALSRCKERSLRNIQVLYTGGDGAAAALCALLGLGLETLRSARVQVQVFLPPSSERAFADAYAPWLTDPAWTAVLVPTVVETGALAGAADAQSAIVVCAAHAELLFGTPLGISALCSQGAVQDDFGETAVSAAASADAAAASAAELDAPWLPAMRAYITARALLPAGREDALLALLRRQAEAAPFPLETARDYLWWAGFSLLWQQTTMRVTASLPRMDPHLAGHVCHFFRSKKWQRWAQDPVHHALLKHPRRASLPGAPPAPLRQRDNAMLLRAAAARVADVPGGIAEETQLAQRVCAMGAAPLPVPDAAFAVTDKCEVIRFGAFSHLEEDLAAAYGDDLRAFLKHDS